MTIAFQSEANIIAILVLWDIFFTCCKSRHFEKVIRSFMMIIEMPRIFLFFFLFEIEKKIPICKQTSRYTASVRPRSSKAIIDIHQYRSN